MARKRVAQVVGPQLFWGTLTSASPSGFFLLVSLLDLTTPIGRGFIAFLRALAEDERQRIAKRANDGRAAARKRGVHRAASPS